MQTKRKSWTKPLLLVLLTLVAFFPNNMLAASDDDMVGTWTAYGTAPNGAPVSVTLRINNGGTGTSTVNIGGNQGSSPFNWLLTSDDIFCMIYPHGRECAKVITVGPVGMTLMNNAGMTTYSRVGSRVPFMGRLHCCRCSCPGWDGAGPDGNCKNPKCRHSYVLHADASGCTYY
jgi:hypothetical protein